MKGAAASAAAAARPARLQLALQGGGAQGAFTWGVLDRLLDEPSIDIGRVSGTSAGALNGAALVSGLARGGRDGAKESLRRLWHGVAAVGSPMTWLMLPLRKPGLGLWDDFMPLLSPYQTNPLGMAPLRTLLAAVVDIDALNAASPSAAASLFVNAVHVQTGRQRVFGPGELSLDALLASACAPMMFQSALVDGEAYWDGSYGGNPLLWPLYEGALDADLLLVELSPPARTETPTTAKNILNRMNEIVSIQALVGELRALDAVNRNVAGADLRLHVVSLPEAGSALEAEPSIKRTVSVELFEWLRRSGHVACSAWLEAHRGSLGVCASVDLDARYLAPYARPAVQLAAT